MKLAIAAAAMLATAAAAAPAAAQDVKIENAVARVVVIVEDRATSGSRSNRGGRRCRRYVSHDAAMPCVSTAVWIAMPSGIAAQARTMRVSRGRGPLSRCAAWAAFAWKTPP